MTLEKSNRELVDDLSFAYVRKGYRSRVRWLLYRLADWADKEEQLAGLEPDRRHHWYTHLVFAPWQEERYQAGNCVKSARSVACPLPAGLRICAPSCGQGRRAL